MSGADDFHAIIENEHSDGCGNEIIAMYERVGEQFFKNNAGNLQFSRGVYPLPALISVKVARNEAKRVIKLRLELSQYIDAIKIGRNVDVIAGIAYRLYLEHRQEVLRLLR